MWEKDLVCKFCQSDLHITEVDVGYKDMRNPVFFIPDYQYFTACSMCGGDLVLSNIPSDIAVAIQDRINAESNESTDNQ